LKINNNGVILNRKIHGIYYTPKYIVRYIVDNTVGKELERLKTIFKKCKKIVVLTTVFKKAKSLKFLDPACGNGVFLLELLKQMRDFYQTYNEKLDDLKLNGLFKISYPGLFALCNNIYGVDKDEDAVKNACINLSEELKPDTEIQPQLLMDLNIKVGNSLISSFEKNTHILFQNNIAEISQLRQKLQKRGVIPQRVQSLKEEIKKVQKPLRHVLNHGLKKYFDIKSWKYKPFNWRLEFPEVFYNNDGFDVIVGNPPYVRVHKQDTLLKHYLKENYMTPKMDFDIFTCFFELSLKILKKNGLLSFIVPDKFLVREYAENLRYLLLNNSHILELLDISKCNIFKESIYPIIITLKKVKELILAKKIVKSYQNEVDIYQINGEINKDLDYVKKLPKSLNKKIAQQKFANNPKARFHINIDEIYDLMGEKLEVLPKIHDFVTNQNIFCGTPRAKDYHSWGKYVTDKKPSKGEFLKYIVCRNLAPFNITWGIPINSFRKTFQTPYFVFKKGVMAEGKWNSFKSVPKILVRGNDKRLTAVLDETGYVFVGIYALIQERYDPKYLIGLINSDLINAYFFHKNPSIKVRGGYFSINSLHLLQLPTFPADKNEILHISKLVSKIIELKGKKGKIEKTAKIIPDSHNLQIEKLITQLNNRIYQLYRLSTNEIKKIQEFVKNCGIKTI